MRRSPLLAPMRKREPPPHEDTVYVAVVISCNVDPSKLIKNIMVEWMRAGGGGLYIKAIPAISTVSPFVIFHLCTTTNTNIIAAELKNMLETGVTLLEDQEMGDKSTPVVKVHPFAMQKNLPNLPGLDPLVYNNLTNKQKALMRACHVEMETQYVKDFARLV